MTTLATSLLVIFQAFAEQINPWTVSAGLLAAFLATRYELSDANILRSFAMGFAFTNLGIVLAAPYIDGYQRRRWEAKKLEDLKKVTEKVCCGIPNGQVDVGTIIEELVEELS